MAIQDAGQVDEKRVHLRRYPNRRYYDAAQSQHITLEDIFRLIGEGQQIQVTDSKSGEDITARVLAQIILEQAPGKLSALPSELLHQIIRANESLLREFVDKYFHRALTAFIRSQRDFDLYLRQALGLGNGSSGASDGLPTPPPAFFPPNWAAMMMGPFARGLFPGGVEPAAAESPVSGSSTDEDGEGSDVRKAVEELKKEVSALRKELKKR